MVLYSFHYLVTSFFLGVWLNQITKPLLIHFLVQMSLFLAGFDITGEERLFWGWQTFVSALGALSGMLLVKPRERPKSLLIMRNKYTFLYFICSVAALLASQLMYAHFPPLSSVPAGEAGIGVAVTFILNFFIILAVWYGLTRIKYNHRMYWRAHFFTKWLFFTALMQLVFYVVLSGFSELYMSIISGGGIAIILFVSGFYRHKFRFKDNPGLYFLRDGGE